MRYLFIEKVLTRHRAATIESIAWRDQSWFTCSEHPRMSLPMYDASIGALIHGLNALSAILKKAAAHAEAKKIDPAVFINARLAPDMYALARQVQITTDTAKGCAARLAEAAGPSFADAETTC